MAQALGIVAVDLDVAVKGLHLGGTVEGIVAVPGLVVPEQISRHIIEQLPGIAGPPVGAGSGNPFPVRPAYAVSIGGPWRGLRWRAHQYMIPFWVPRVLSSLWFLIRFRLQILLHIGICADIVGDFPRGQVLGKLSHGSSKIVLLVRVGPCREQHFHDFKSLLIYLFTLFFAGIVA